MDKLINEILEEESLKTGIAVDRLEFLAEYGCNIAFKDDLRTRIGLFGGSDFFTEEKLKEFILVLIDGAEARIDGFDISYDNLDDDKNWVMIEKKFLNDFYKLPVLYEINGFRLRDISELDRNINYIDLFIENYKSNFSDFYDNVFFDDEVTHKIEMECEASRFLSMEEFFEVIESKFVPFDSEDSELEGDEFLAKYRNEAKLLLSDMGKIMQFIWDSAFYLQQEYSFLDKSLFISMYHDDYRLDWSDWKELEDIVKK